MMADAAVSKARVLLVASGKGGTGKSTVAGSMAHLLATAHARSVALMDFDPQASLTVFLGQRPQADPLAAESVLVAEFDLYRGGAAVSNASEDDISAWVDRALERHAVVIADLRGTLDDNGHTLRLLERPDVHLLIVPAGEQRSIPEVRKLSAAAEGQQVGYSILVNKRQRRASSRMATETMRSFWQSAVVGEIPDLAEVGVAESRLQPVTMALPRSTVSLRLAAFVRALVEEGVV